MVRACSKNGENKTVYKLLVRKPEGKRPLGRPRCRWFDNIKMDVAGIRLVVVDCCGLTQERYRWRALVNEGMNLRIPQNAGKLSSGCTNCDLSSSTHLHRARYSVSYLVCLYLSGNTYVPPRPVQG
jgi:hypothetical protein